MRKLFFFTTCVCFLFTAQAQEEEQIKNDILRNRLAFLMESEEHSQSDYSGLVDLLEHYYEYPLNLNHSNKKELQSLQLLSDFQIMNLLLHIEKTGKLLALEELQALRGFDKSSIDRILPFVSIGKNPGQRRITFGSVWSKGESSLFLRWKRKYQKNFTSLREDDYEGNPGQYYLRYKYTLGKRLSFGLTAEKDAGEAFFGGSNRHGFDYNSAYCFIRNRGFLKKLALGDYRIGFGQGLVSWSGRAFGKSPQVHTVKRTASGLTPYSSVDENNFMRGSGFTVENENISFTGFFSRLKKDANVLGFEGEDSIPVISSFQQTGWHRTEDEINDEDAVRDITYGSHLSYEKRSFTCGVSFIRNEANAIIIQRRRKYKDFSPEGSRKSNLGVNYNYLVNNFNFFGETAWNLKTGWAAIHGGIVVLDPSLAFTFVHRYYTRNYTQSNGNAFGAGSGNSNEHGLYMGLKYRFSEVVSLAAYLDRYRFPWLKFGVSAPSGGNDYLAQLTYEPNKKLSVYYRLRGRQKTVDGKTDDTSPVLLLQRKFNHRFNLVSEISPVFRLKSRVELSDFSKGESGEKGFLISQDLIFKSMNVPVSLALRFAIFDTESYAARIYAYEHDVLYSFSVPAYFRSGTRMYVNIRYKLSSSLDLWLRWAQSKYSGGEGEEVDNELKAQVRVRF